MIEVRSPAEYWQVYNNDHPLISHHHNKYGNNVFRIRDAVTRWLKDNIGSGRHFRNGGQGGYVFETSEDGWSWDFDGDGGDVVFYFKDPGPALLFKLTWIGQ